MKEEEIQKKEDTVQKKDFQYTAKLLSKDKQQLEFFDIPKEHLTSTFALDTFIKNNYPNYIWQ